MCVIHKNIIINVPATDVWEVLGDPAQWSRLNPNISQYKFTP